MMYQKKRAKQNIHRHFDKDPLSARSVYRIYLSWGGRICRISGHLHIYKGPGRSDRSSTQQGHQSWSQCRWHTFAMGGDNSRLSEGRAVWSAVRMQRAREKFWDQTKKVGTDTATQHKSIPIDLPLGLTSACAEKNNYNFEEVRHNFFFFFLFFSFLVVRDRSEISGNYFDFASLLPPLVQKGKRNNEIHTFFPPASRRMNAQCLSNRVSYLLFPSLRLDFLLV